MSLPKDWQGLPNQAELEDFCSGCTATAGLFSCLPTTTIQFAPRSVTSGAKSVAPYQVKQAPTVFLNVKLTATV